MKPDLLSGVEAAAYGAMLSGVELVPNFPGPSLHTLTDKLRSRGVVADFDSQGSAITAAIGAVACEKRVFLPLDGLHAFGDLFRAASMRMPFVAAGTSYSMRDSGAIIFVPASNQEILDTVIQAYRICEDSSVMLPGLVCIDFPELREPVIVPKEQSMKGFLPKMRIMNKIDNKKPLVIGADGFCLETMLHQQKAMENAMKLIQKTDEVWKNKFKRSYGLLETYMLEDAETAFVVAGSDSLTARVTVERLREQGEKVGMLKIRVLRPFPSDAVRDALKQIKHVGVIDRFISPGSSGILYKEIKECYCGACSNFITGRMTENDFINIFKQLKNIDQPERFWLV